MKKVLIATAAIILVAGGAMAASDIANTKHNFSNSGTPNPGDWANNEICAPCHVPHGGDQSVAPLWAHDQASASRAYTRYSSTTMNATPDTTLGTTHAGTRLCLSCHDDTVALAAFTGATSTGTETISDLYTGSNAIIGTDLGNDHPVMFTYQDSIDNGDLELVAAGTGDMRLWNNEVECLSCHDPHGEDGVNYLLWKDNAGSAICFDCHNK
jgi:predicted CXXCH cytochrome family protein